MVVSKSTHFWGEVSTLLTTSTWPCFGREERSQECFFGTLHNGFRSHLRYFVKGKTTVVVSTPLSAIVYRCCPGRLSHAPSRDICCTSTLNRENGSLVLRTAVFLQFLIDCYNSSAISCWIYFYGNVIDLANVCALSYRAWPAANENMAMDDQEKLLTEALNQVKKNAFEMKTCLVRWSFFLFCCIEGVSSVRTTTNLWTP